MDTARAVQPLLAEAETLDILDFVGKHNGAGPIRAFGKAQDGASNDSLVIFSYLAGGAANVVFRIRLDIFGLPGMRYQFVHVSNIGNNITPVSSQALPDKVLRVPRGYPEHLTGQEILAGLKDIESLFAPLGWIDTVGALHGELARVPVEKRERYALMTKHLIDHEEVFLTTEVIVDLAKGLRPPLGPHLTGRLALLLPDLASVPGKALSLEFKPKWLLQSPNAPNNACRCRTCAMQFESLKQGAAFICPLRMVDGEYDDLKPWIVQRVQELYKTEQLVVDCLPPENEVVEQLLKFYTGDGDGRTLLMYLRWLQSQLDQQGVLSTPIKEDLSELWEHNLRLAMTLRDCSVFINIPYRDGRMNGAITAKLGDLDFKSARKIPDWAKKERELVAKEYYTHLSPFNPRDHIKEKRCWIFQECSDHMGTR